MSEDDRRYTLSDVRAMEPLGYTFERTTPAFPWSEYKVISFKPLTENTDHWLPGDEHGRPQP